MDYFSTHRNGIIHKEVTLKYCATEKNLLPHATVTFVLVTVLPAK